MKANRKFLHGDEEAVSPVIAVILMVAITVVLAATVYVWVSGFGSNTNSSPAHTLSLTSAGALGEDDAVTPNDYKSYTVASADPTLTWADMKITIGGVELEYTAIATACSDGAEDDADFAADTFVGCSASANELETASVNAGDQLVVKCTGDCDDEELLIVDREANSVMVTLKLR